MRGQVIGFLILRFGITDRGAEVLVYEFDKRLQADFDVGISNIFVLQNGSVRYTTPPRLAGLR